MSCDYWLLYLDYIVQSVEKICRYVSCRSRRVRTAYQHVPRRPEKVRNAYPTRLPLPGIICASS